MDIESHISLSTKTIALGFVVYRPEPDFIEKLKIVEKLGFVSYVFDNSPDFSLVRDFCRSLKDCYYVTCGKNVGLGYGISSVCAQAFYDSYGALLFFDQDTMFNAETLMFIQGFYEENDGLKSDYSSIVFNSRDGQKDILRKVEIRDVFVAISSGSLFFLENLKKLNWHNTNYFVDCVDYEFCLNSNNNKFKIGEFSSTPGFDHQTGQPDKLYRIFGKGRFIRKYPPSRFFDYFKASIKLIFQSIKTMNFRFAQISIRSLLIYLYFQFIIRIIKVTDDK